jgi:hypothetical protein
MRFDGPDMDIEALYKGIFCHKCKGWQSVLIWCGRCADTGKEPIPWECLDNG